MFTIDGGRVGGRFLYAEMIPHLARVDGSRSLRDQLCPPHRLAIPIRGRVAMTVSKGTEEATGTYRVIFTPWLLPESAGFL